MGFAHLLVVGAKRSTGCMNVLVVWESKHASTAEIGFAIGQTLREHGLHVILSDAASAPDDVEFDAYVIGSAVYAGHWMKRIKQYVHDNRLLLLSHPVWLFSSGPIGDPPMPAEPPVDIAEVFECTAAREHKIFAGRLDRAKLSFVERAIAAALRAPQGDFRNWDAILGWADDIAEALKEKTRSRYRKNALVS